jgi:ABC-type branched-subunit amino acid transport system substrate-binding protein
VNSVECAQVAKYTAHYRKKTLLSEAIDDSITDHVSSTLLFQQTSLNTGKLAARYFYSNIKKDRMLILFDESNQSFRSIAKGFISEGNLVGAQVYEESFDSTLGKIDFNRVLSRIKSVSPQIIYLCIYEKNVEEILTLTLKTFEIPSMLFLNKVPSDLSLASRPELYRQLFCITTFFEQKDAFISSSFFQSYGKKFNQKPDYYASLGYDEMMLVREMIKKNSNQYSKELFSQLKGLSFDPEFFVTGFRGFSSDGLAKRPIDVLKIVKGKVSLQETFFSEVSLRR